ncbi:SIMPL domain-containing protein [Utexia brackfieldae]|uniref:SIMPL domain-containing protein n=1 Tax=Utexia brackfieldae TaxID=3074108 RepID=UPI00370DAE74
MKTKLLLIVTLLNMGLFSVSAAQAAPLQAGAADSIQSQLELDSLLYGAQLISVGQLNTSVTENIKLKPDTATFSITYLTQASDSVEAANQNAEGMKSLNSYLTDLGISSSDLVTTSYRNYANIQPSDSKQPVRYQTQLSVLLDIAQPRFFDVVNLLATYDISDLKRVEGEDYYTFTISQSADSADQSKQAVNQTYQQIASKLKKLSLEDIVLQNYSNSTLPISAEPVKTYFVENTLQIKVKDFDQLGKIIAKAQSLKMNVNDDIEYSVSNEAKEAALAKQETTLLGKLTEKAKRLLTQQDYQLGVANHLQFSELGANLPIVQPRYNLYAKSQPIAMMTDASDNSQINIQPPSEFELTVMLSGQFSILKPIRVTGEQTDTTTP